MKNLLLLIFLLFSVGLSAQNERFKKGGKSADKPAEQNEAPETPKKAVATKKASWTDKLIFGGGAGASFGNNTNIFLAPQVGYQVKENSQSNPNCKLQQSHQADANNFAAHHFKRSH